MIKLLKKIYLSLPVIRELRRCEFHMARSLKLLEVANVIQTFEALKAGNERYRDPRRLLSHGAQYWSQNYEDGMIAEIFRRIGIKAKTFVEIGVGDGRENNTSALLAEGWSGWWIDGDQKAHETIITKLQDTPTVAARLRVKQSFVTPETVNGLLEELGIPGEVDFFSLDIDLDTYHIWAALKNFRPRVVVVEYNAAFPANFAWVHPYRKMRVWDGSQAFGASLKAFEELGAKYGYSLVGCDIIGANAFFVRNDLVGQNFVAPFTAENHYEPQRYHLVSRTGHPPSTPFFEP
jgi:hypothetical protein